MRRYFNLHLPMRDGVPIAIDVYLPRQLPERGAPAILHQTRYFRSMHLRRPLKYLLGGRPFDHTEPRSTRRNRFLKAGYAWIDVDVRGSGASGGSRICPWSPDEIRDGAEIVDWLTRQPWCNGLIGSTGNSYSGTTAEMLLINKHPAVKAIIPRFSLYDTFTDIAYPGGIHLSWFTETWHEMNSALDRNAPHDIVGRWLKLLSRGVTPVEGVSRDELAAIIEARSNYDVHEEALGVTYRDDVSPSDPFHAGRQDATSMPVGRPLDTDGSIGLFSPHNYRRDIEESGAAIFSWSGWWDGGYAHSAIKRFLSVEAPSRHLILGPWNHGGGWDYEPGDKPRRAAFDAYGEMIRFFDLHLRGIDNEFADVAPVRYFVMGRQQWRSAHTWPPPGTTTHRLYLARDLRLRRQAPSDAAEDVFRVDLGHGTGTTSRWRALAERDARVAYLPRDGLRCITWTSEALPAELVVAGHPQVILHVRCDHPDAQFFAYLEEVDGQGRAHLVTEGQLRALHRVTSQQPLYQQVPPWRSYKRADGRTLEPGEIAEISFDLLPVAHAFARGHAVRLSVAGADVDHFAPLPRPAPTWQILRSSEYPSRLELPVCS